MIRVEKRQQGKPSGKQDGEHSREDSQSAASAHMPTSTRGPGPALNDSLHMSTVTASCHVSGLEEDATVKEKFENPGLNGQGPFQPNLLW